ncbi:hypothetical protein HYPSUDRAFT_338122 [Hypholoma sublateritium FD-334 SS-4]|uniref:Uncharacterized protein n=1 Tax=Hypholoma sublateritium (strain FD-334 SS-4) TaxID=945553 RepID=A0A0D2N9H8_HYPSF|nr:hypothetical protein HYPSUDRAFT_338122 [Hypholoma sublateritium FD-334 SS-4]
MQSYGICRGHPNCLRNRSPGTRLPILIAEQRLSHRRALPSFIAFTPYIIRCAVIVFRPGLSPVFRVVSPFQ